MEPHRPLLFHLQPIGLPGTGRVRLSIGAVEQVV
jgi:hypothetical protein